MDESKRQNFESLKEAEAEAETITREDEEHEGDYEDEELDDDDDDDGEDEFYVEQRRKPSELLQIEALSKSETGPAASLSENDLKSYFASSSNLLSEVPVDYALLRPLESPNFEDQVGVSHQQALASVITEASQSQLHNEVTMSSRCPTSSELSRTSVTQSISSGQTSNRKSILSTDGYNWRKYGQKQVKIPQGSRSYYRCTYSDCRAKKIEFCDLLNRIVEIISKGEHNHDPPRRINCTRERGLALPALPISTSHPVRMLNDSDPSTSLREVIQEIPVLPETKRQNSIRSNGTAKVDIEEHVDELEPKRRVKKGNTAYSGSPFQPCKKPKVVVHAAGNVGISGDGYRWRKYGQKMVKGNPHPRNYYRCTSAGCPVRKHIERAVDNTTALILTYKGVHDHDMPVPKKRHGPPSASLVAASINTTNSQVNDHEQIQNNLTSPTQWSVDTQGVTSEAVDTGEEKTMESARTLLSIGFEIKQC